MPAGGKTGKKIGTKQSAECMWGEGEKAVSLNQNIKRMLEKRWKRSICREMI